MSDNVTTIMDIGILDTKKLEFTISSNGFLGLKYDGKEYPRVVLSRILPYKEPDKYISVLADDTEIGILDSISSLSKHQAEIVCNELGHRYFCPRIIEMKSVKEKLGYLYIEAVLSSGEKTFAIKDFSRNIRTIDENRLVIFDVDGNRYSVDDMNLLDSKSRKRIEPYLF